MCSRSLRNGYAKPSFSHDTKSKNALERSIITISTDFGHRRERT
jgi:hypothetical protein